jgi:hypothetical protein
VPDSENKIRGPLSPGQAGLETENIGRIILDDINTNIDFTELGSFSARPIEIEGLADKIKSAVSGL